MRWWTDKKGDDDGNLRNIFIRFDWLEAIKNSRKVCKLYLFQKGSHYICFPGVLIAEFITNLALDF